MCVYKYNYSLRMTVVGLFVCFSFFPSIFVTGKLMLSGCCAQKTNVVHNSILN